MKVVRSSLLLAIIVGVSVLMVSSPVGWAQPGCTSEGVTAGSESCDGSVPAFMLTLTDVVGITVTGTVTNGFITRAALNNRFLPLSSSVTVDIFAITNYQVFGSVVITDGTTAGTFVADNVLQVDLGAFVGADDVGDNPTDVTLAGCVIASVSDATACTTLPNGAAGAPGGVGIQLWTGGNTLGGALQSHQAAVAFRIDKDALGNASTTVGVPAQNVFNFVVTFRVLEV